MSDNLIHNNTGTAKTSRVNDLIEKVFKELTENFSPEEQREVIDVVNSSVREFWDKKRQDARSQAEHLEKNFAVFNREPVPQKSVGY